MRRPRPSSVFSVFRVRKNRLRPDHIGRSSQAEAPVQVERSEFIGRAWKGADGWRIDDLMFSLSRINVRYAASDSTPYSGSYTSAVTHKRCNKIPSFRATATRARAASDSRMRRCWRAGCSAAARPFRAGRRRNASTCRSRCRSIWRTSPLCRRATESSSRATSTAATAATARRRAGTG